MRVPDLFRRRPKTDQPAIREMIQAFESFGQNCEFGLVQRYLGAEPLGLFRFSNTSELEPLVHALDTDFVHYGGDDDLVVEESASGQWSCRSRRYGFGYDISDIPPSMTTEALLAREARKVGYLKRRLLEVLAGGEKIVVRKVMPQDDPEAVRGFARAIARHGPSPVLHVREAADDLRPGMVRWRGDGVMEGSVRRFSPQERAYEIDLESWLDLCRNAHGLARGPATADPPLPPRNLLTDASPRPTEHVLGHGTDVGAQGLELFETHRTAKHLDPDAVHVFSAWIWIPPGFTGRRLDAAISGNRLGWRPADLSLRDTWQRVWIGARVPPDVHTVVIGLVTDAPAGQRFWSVGWRLEEAPVPAPAQPPSIRIGPLAGT